jgi:predicted membrane channel-forming protein YqfA (hemolysin III family)
MRCLEMRLSAPKFVVFIISLVFALIGILPLIGVAIPSVGISAVWALAIGYVVLAVGVLFKGA